jgi:hypothetical protein
VPESKVISFDKRAEDEEKSFFEQLLQEGARKLLQAAIENEVMDYIQFHKDRRDKTASKGNSVPSPAPPSPLRSRPSLSINTRNAGYDG